MKVNEQNAYLHLIYRAFVEIRNISVFPFSWWNPCSWGRRNRFLWRINRLADAFHNLPFELKTENIAAVDEKYFWEKIKRYEREFQNSNNVYSSLFERVLSGETRKVID